MPAFTNGDEAIRLLEELDIDLMLIDMVMPGSGAIKVTARTRSANPCLKVIAMSMHNDKRMVEAAFAAGVSAYLLKEHLDRDLSDALAAVVRGETYLSEGLTIP